MKKVYATLETGFCNAYYEEYFEFEDDVSEKEIYSEIYDWADNIFSEMTVEWRFVEEEGE